MNSRELLFARCAAGPSLLPHHRRQAVAEALRATPWSWQGPRGQQALDDLANGAPVLVSGQQAGLALGPALLLWKCLALLKTVRMVEAETGRRPVALLWLEGNDHDWAEASHAGWPQREDPAAPEHLAGRSVGRVDLDDSWWRKTQDGASALGLEGQDPLGSLWRSSGRGSLVEHSAALLHGLLPDQGLLCLDPSRPSLRALAFPLLRSLADQGEALTRCVEADSHRLASEGLPTPVQSDAHPLLFGEDKQGRRRRLRHGDPLPQPDALSPSALGRVLLQDALLDPVAAFLGPTELAYHRQVESASRLLGLPEVLRLPRPHVQLSRREDLVAWEALGGDPWRPSRPGQPWPMSLLEVLPGGEALRKNLGHTLDLEKQWLELCAGRAGAFPGLATRHAALVAQLGQALVEEHKAAHKTHLKDLHARALWQDGDIPQERRVNTLALLGRMGGMRTVDQVLAALDPFAHGQQRIICEGD